MKQPHLSKVLLLLLVTAFLGLLVFTGCETEKEVIKTEEVIVHDTITVNIISVDSIFATPDSVTQGKSIMLTADVTTQPEAGALTFKWFAEAGSFDNAEGDTVSWTAPDSAGVYVVSVHATDGEFIGIGSRMVGVDMFAPTVTPYYVSDAACSQCHPGMHDDWEMTGHAEAWAGLMTSSHAGPSCFPCHAVGYEPQPNTGNSGHDEAPIDKFVDVQCENCHGPGSDHADGPSPANITVDWDALVCGKCHDGEHHPYYTEWQDSPHGFDPATSAHGAPANSFCQGCHEGVAAAYRLSGDVSS
ncbi:MAG: hypothetical protein GWN13_15645, partial [Phycisphaerae bacterium]|nr:hypothetical protein [Phycisphaerae bacterium]